VERYISNHWNNRPEYNDMKPLYDEEIYERLNKAGGWHGRDGRYSLLTLCAGIDELLAKHISYLFIRDPIVVFSEMLDQNDAVDNDHFENLQSTNWQTVRFKPPGSPTMGWRVEFRSMEVQVTDFENAAFSVFLVLLTRAILAFNLNFYMPISRVDENMQRAQKRNAAREGSFFFRKNVFPRSGTSTAPSASGSTSPTTSDCGCDLPGKKEKKLRNCYPAEPEPLEGIMRGNVEDEYEEMTVEEIMNGKVSQVASVFLQLLTITGSGRWLPRPDGSCIFFPGHSRC
jgi:glutamate--cysteine ligase catalytic subunit